MARNAVGAVNSTDTPYSASTRQNAPASGVPDGLALVDDGGVSVEQRRVADVRVSDHPADVGRGPVHLAGLDPVDVLHRPLQRDGVAAVVANHALGLAGGAGGVEDVEGIGGRDRHAVVRLGARHGLHPVDVASLDEVAWCGFALEDDAGARLVGGEIDGAVEQRLVVDHPTRLDTARCRDDRHRRRIVDAYRELVRGEAAEHHRMHRPEPSAGEHRDDRLGDHRHVDDDPVALAHPAPGQHPGEPRDLVAELRVGVAALVAGDRTVVDESRLVAATGLDVDVERVVAGIELSAREPAVARRVRVVQHPLPAFRPVDGFGRLRPERIRIRKRSRVDFCEST